MIITKLELENWLKIRKLLLEFQPGINLVYGPNEIGKSSIIEAIKQAILGDPQSSGREYKRFQTWGAGTAEKARVTLSFTTRGGQLYHLCKSFPKIEAGLYAGNVKLSDDPIKTQQKLFEILSLPEKTRGLFDLLFIHQGTALNIFDKKKNPLDEDTRTHIKNVIKETAFKSLQQFQDHLHEQRDELFTNPTAKKFKSGKNAPEYIRLLEKERELNQHLVELEEKTAEFSLRLEEMENLDIKIQKAEGEKKSSESHLEMLKIKVARWEDLEKKQLVFKPFEQEYKRFLGIEEQLTVLQRELTGWHCLAENVIAGLAVEIKELQSQAADIGRQQTALKLKKEACTRVNEYRQSFECIHNEYVSLQSIKNSLEENEQRLALFIDLNKKVLTEKAVEIQGRIQDRLKKQSELLQYETELNEYPVMTAEVVSHIKKAAAEIDRLKDRLADAQAALKMKCTIIPQEAREIRFNLKIDENGWIPQSTAAPMDVENFHRLTFQYPGEFYLEMSGSPAHVDIETLGRDIKQKQEELNAGLAALKVDNLMELEKKFTEYSLLKNNVIELRNLLQQMPGLEELEIQKAEISTNLEELTTPLAPLVPDVQLIPPVQYPVKSVPSVPSVQSVQTLRDEWTKAKTLKESLSLQQEAVLKGRTFESFANEHAAKEKELAQLLNSVSAMEPLDRHEVTQEHLDELVEKLNAVEQKIAAKIKDRELLTTISGSEEFPKFGELPDLGVEPFAVITKDPQQIREAIYHNRAHLLELHKQWDDYLAGRKPDDIKIDYGRQKEALDNMGIEISALPPAEVKRLEELKKMISNDQQQINKLVTEIEESRSRKARLSGEISGFGGFEGVMEEKNRVHYDHGKVLAEIKSQLIEIYSLKLLLKLIEEEKEKAHQEVFKPLERRVMENFDRLIPGRYRLEVDNELKLGVKALTSGGKVIEGVGESLSFGTREQLSFLLRLAIGGQLSRKEPQVMVLDDSFVNTDSTRLPGLLEMIEQGARDMQFLIFTCRERDYLLYKEKYHAINLEYLL